MDGQTPAVAHSWSWLENECPVHEILSSLRKIPDLILQQCVMALWTLWRAMVHQLEIKFVTRRGGEKEKKEILLAEEAYIWCFNTSEHFQIVNNFQNDSFAICLTVIKLQIIPYNYTPQGWKVIFCIGLCMCAAVWRVALRMQPPPHTHSHCSLFISSAPDVFHVSCIEIQPWAWTIRGGWVIFWEPVLRNQPQLPTPWLFQVYKNKKNSYCLPCKWCCSKYRLLLFWNKPPYDPGHKRVSSSSPSISVIVR